MFEHPYKLLAEAVEGNWLREPLHPRRKGSTIPCWMVESGPEDAGTTRVEGSFVGAVLRGTVGGSGVMVGMETQKLVVQSSSVMRTRQSRFVGSRHP